MISQKKHAKQKQVYLQKSLFIDSKTTKITDDYKFLKEIGRGISGIVYQASCKLDQRRMRAIKKVSKKSSSNQQDNLNQVKCLKEVDHPCIIRLYETYEDQNYLYYVTDFCEGGELFDYLQKKCSLTQNEARQIFNDMLSAIKYCHGQNIAHRDLKPENFLLLDLPGQTKKSLSIKLIDFGLAFKWKQNMQQQILKTQKNKLVGTAYYISPEVISGKYDHKCDIWSLGVILYILVTGVPPFDGQTDQQILKNISKLKFSLSIPEMDSVSLFLKDLIKRMLKPAAERITIDQIFQHPWMTVKNNKPPFKVDFKAMAGFSKFSKIKTIAATYIASQMTAKQIGNFQRLFKELDENHDGYLSFEELQKYMLKNKSKEKEVTINELRGIIDSIDTDKNGKINYTQFIASTLPQQALNSKQNLQKVFSMLDKDGNGKIEKEQLFVILHQHGHISSERALEDLNEIFASTDTNKDGMIDFDEFVVAITKIV